MTLLAAVFVFLTYTDPAASGANLRPSIALSLFGGWADFKEFDDAHIRPVRREVPDEKNGLAELRKAVASVPEAEWEAESEELRQFGKGEEANDLELARTILQRRADLFREIDAMLEKPHLQFPLVENVYDSTAELFKALELASYLRCRIRLHAELEEWDQAVAGVRPLLVFGNRIIEGEGSLVHYLVGIAMKMSACREIERLLNEPRFPVPLIPELRATLALRADHRAACDFVWRNEYLMLANILQDLTRGLGFEVIQAMGGTLQTGWGATWRACLGQAGFTLFLQPNMTRKNLATCFQYFQALTALPPHERSKVERPKWIDRIRNKDLFAARGVNWIGNVLLILGLPQLEKAIYRMDLVQANVDALHILCALRQYENREGSLPRTLGDLVPLDMKVLPRDRFSAKRFFFSAEDRRFWSVGEDGISQGGEAETRYFADPRHRKDLTMSLRWLEEKR